MERHKTGLRSTNSRDEFENDMDNIQNGRRSARPKWVFRLNLLDYSVFLFQCSETCPQCRMCSTYKLVELA